MKMKSKKQWRTFFIGVVVGILVWFILDLAFNWDDHLRDYWKGYDAAKDKFENTN